MYALCNTYVKRRFNHVPVIALVLAMLAISTIVLTPPALLLDTPGPDGPILHAAGAVVMVGMLSTGIGMLMFYKLIRATARCSRAWSATSFPPSSCWSATCAARGSPGIRWAP